MKVNNVNTSTEKEVSAQYYVSTCGHVRSCCISNEQCTIKVEYDKTGKEIRRYCFACQA